MLTPENAGEFRERGMLYCQLETLRLARTDLVEYLERRPDAPDCSEVEKVLESVEERLRMLH